MESQFKLRLIRFLSVSFGTVCSMKLSTFLQKAVCAPRRNRKFHVIGPIRRKVRLFPSFCRPGSSKMLPTLVSYKNDKFEFPICDSSPFLAGIMDGRTYPPATPFSPANFIELKDQRRKEKRVRRRMSANRSSDHMGLLTLRGKTRDSLAIVKESSDPYYDFRTSMVEMIMEKQMFSANDLEQLLECFLSLNSHQHHGIIVQVFSEIWEALFQTTNLDHKTTNKSSLFLRLL